MSVSEAREYAKRSNVRCDYLAHVTSHLVFCDGDLDAERSLIQLRINRPEYFFAQRGYPKEKQTEWRFKGRSYPFRNALERDLQHRMADAGLPPLPHYYRYSREGDELFAMGTRRHPIGRYDDPPSIWRVMIEGINVR